jgi:ankyrin repeat protein
MGTSQGFFQFPGMPGPVKWGHEKEKPMTTSRSKASLAAELIGAAHKGDINAIDQAIAKGADILATDNNMGLNALHQATKNSQVDAMLHLIKRGIPIDSKDSHGRTALYITAVDQLPLEVSAALLACGANTEEHGSSKNRTALIQACMYGKLDRVRQLLDHGASTDAREAHGATPLIQAAHQGRSEIVAELVQRGVDLEAVDEKGRTALHWAVARSGSHQSALNLLNAGANVHAKDKKGRTPWDLAQANHSQNTLLHLTLIAWAGTPAKTGMRQLARNLLGSKQPEENPAAAMRRAAAEGGFTQRMSELLRDPTCSLDCDGCQELVRLARGKGHHATVAVIQSFMANQAVEQAMNVPAQRRAISV